MIIVALIALSVCEKEIASVNDEVVNSDVNVPTKKFTFTVKGDFDSPTFTRGYLTATDNTLTDLWVYDFVGDECVQSIHQSNADEAWGQPQLQLTYGSHHIYFVASRGTEPTVNTTDNTIIWTKPSDTFWKDYSVDVVSTSNGNRAVSLDRVVTKLKVTINDEVPSNISTLTLTPYSWYYGVNYKTGEPYGEVIGHERSVTVPNSYISTSGQLMMSIFGFSSNTEWSTNINVVAKDGNGNIIGQSTINDAPFVRNRSTEYSGCLFQDNSSFTLSVNDVWEDAYEGTW